MRFLDGQVPDRDLTYDDVFLVPGRSAVASRFDVDLTTADGSGATVPVIAANMTAVAGRRMAETLARRGALTVLPQDVAPEAVAEIVAWIKSRHPVLGHPARAAHRRRRRGRAEPAAASGRTARWSWSTTPGARSAPSTRRRAPVSTASPASPTCSTRHRSPCRWTPRRGRCSRPSARAAWRSVSTRDGRLAGLLTRSVPCAPRSTRPPSTTAAGCARPPRSASTVTSRSKAKALLDAGVDVLVVDTAHGHQEKMLDALRAVRSVVGRGRRPCRSSRATS